MLLYILIQYLQLTFQRQPSPLGFAAHYLHLHGAAFGGTEHKCGFTKPVCEVCDRVQTPGDSFNNILYSDSYRVCGLLAATSKRVYGGQTQ